MTDEDPVIAEIRQHSERLEGVDELEPLVDRLREKKCVMIGEASHGTSEFYRYRNRLTRKLIEDGEISFIGVEGDWPDCYKINRYVKNKTDKTAKEVLEEFERWPTWMWSNWEVLEFIEWLREYNKDRVEEEKVGFYGLDLYSLKDSMERIVDYLDTIDSEAAEDAKEAYQCLDSGMEGADYAEKLRMVPESCEDQVVEVLSEIRRNQFEYEQFGEEKFFDIEQNALVAKNAEKYYRSLVRGDKNSWNVRDKHMFETLEKLMEQYGASARSVVWAHNSHIGDSSATEMEIRGEINIGKLARNRWEETALIGFSTFTGNVIASDYWGGDMKSKKVPEAKEGSYDELLHRVGGDRIVFLEDSKGLRTEKGHRAIGVVYKPEREGFNYVPTRLADRYDHLIFIDQTSSLNPLKKTGGSEEPETYPWGV